MQTSESANPCSAADGLETWSQSLDLAALGAKWGTPCYLFNASRLRQNVAAWLKLVEQPERILYPVKTNPALAVLRRLATLGCGLDCASRDEVDLGLTAGVPMKRISYNTPAPEVGLIRNLLRGGATVVVDSAEMLRRINDKLPPSHLRETRDSTECGCRKYLFAVFRVGANGSSWCQYQQVRNTRGGCHRFAAGH